MPTSSTSSTSIYPDGRRWDTNDTISTPDGLLECTAVSYSEDAEGTKTNFSYTFQHVDDMKAQKAREEAEYAAANPSTPEER